MSNGSGHTLQGFFESLAMGGTGFDQATIIGKNKAVAPAVPLKMSFTAEDLGYLTVRMGLGSFEEVVNSMVEFNMLLLEAHDKGFKPCLRSDSGELYSMQLPFTFSDKLAEEDDNVNRVTEQSSEDSSGE